MQIDLADLLLSWWQRNAGGEMLGAAGNRGDVRQGV